MRRSGSNRQALGTAIALLLLPLTPVRAQVYQYPTPHQQVPQYHVPQYHTAHPSTSWHPPAFHSPNEFHPHSFHPPTSYHPHTAQVAKPVTPPRSFSPQYPRQSGW
jgi:hypothetical protein